MSFDKGILRKTGKALAAGMSPQVAQSQMAIMRQNEQNEAEIEASLLDSAIKTAQSLPDNDPRKIQILQNDVIPILERRAPTIAETFKRGLPSVTGINPVEQGGVPQPEVTQQDAQIPGFMTESADAAENRLELERIEKQRQAVKQRIPQLIEDPGQRDTFLTLADTTDDPAGLLKTARDLNKPNVQLRNINGRVTAVDMSGGDPRVIKDLGEAPGGFKGRVVTPDGTEINFGDVAPDSRVAKAFEGVSERRTNADLAVDLISEMRDMVTRPEFVGGTAEDIIRAGNSLIQQAGNLFGLSGAVEDKNGVQVIGEEFINENSQEAKALREAAITGDELSALQLQAAYVMAKQLDPGGRISDADVRNAKQIFGTGGDPKSRVRVLNNLEDRVKRQANIYIEGQERLFNDSRFRRFKYESGEGKQEVPDFSGMNADELSNFDYSQLNEKGKKAYLEALDRALGE